MKLQKTDRERFDSLKKTVSDGMAICLIVGAALREIKVQQYYLADGHETFEAFVNSEWGWTKRYANQLVADADAIQSLPESMQKMITSHRAAAELARIPEVLRVEVVKVASQDGGPISAAKLRASAPPIPPRASQSPPQATSAPPGRPAPQNAPEGQPQRGKSGPKPEIARDMTGIAIPPESIDLWRRQEDAISLVTYIGGVISRLEDYQDDKHPLFVEVDFIDDLAKLKSVRKDLQRAIPFAVCPECNGVQPKGCRVCKGRGIISRFLWETVVPEEIRNLRSKPKK